MSDTACYISYFLNTSIKCRFKLSQVVQPAVSQNLRPVVLCSGTTCFTCYSFVAGGASSSPADMCTSNTTATRLCFPVRRFVCPRAHIVQQTCYSSMRSRTHRRAAGFVLNYAPISRCHLGRLILICGGRTGSRRRAASAPPNRVGN